MLAELDRLGRWKNAVFKIGKIVKTTVQSVPLFRGLDLDTDDHLHADMFVTDL